MELDAVIAETGARRGGGRPPRAARTGAGYSQMAGKTHLKGVSLQEVAQAGDDERCDCNAPRNPPPCPPLTHLRPPACSWWAPTPRPRSWRCAWLGAATLAHNSPLNALASQGSICYVTREGAPPTLLPLGATCVNQAVKGVAIARKYLVQDSVDLTLEPRFREARARRTVSLHLTAVVYEPDSTPPANEVTLTVGASSQPALVAGAISNKVREKLPVCVKAVGAVAVANAVYAVAHAKEYLAKDGISIVCMPDLQDEELGSGGEERTVTVVKFTICISSGETAAEPVIKVAAAPRRERVPRSADAPAVRRGGREPGAEPVRRGGGRAPARGEPVRRGGRVPPKSSEGEALKVTVVV